MIQTPHNKLLKQKKSKLTTYIKFKINNSLLIRRITERLIHPPNKKSYHIKFNPPKIPIKNNINLY